MRAANDGVVSFAGAVAGTLHVTVAHAGGLRTSYSFLADVSVRAGSGGRRAATSLGTTGGAGADHDGTTGLSSTSGCGSATATSIRCSSSARATSPSSCTSSRPTSPTETPWSPAQERRDLQSSLRLPSPGAAPGAARTPTTTTCDTGLPLIGDAVDAVCDVGGWLGDHAATAVDAGIDFLDATTDLAADALDDLRAAAHDVGVDAMRSLGRAAAGALARTPAGQVALDLVAIGRRFVDTRRPPSAATRPRPTAPVAPRTG